MRPCALFGVPAHLAESRPAGRRDYSVLTLRTVIALPLALCCLGIGLAAGLALKDDPAPGASSSDPTATVVLVEDGVERSYTTAEIAARIERLESVQRRRRERDAQAAARSADDGSVADAQPTAPAEAVPPMPTRPDGRPYSVADLIELAKTSTDPELRKAAIRRLRWVDTPAAREVLTDLIGNSETPLEMRLAAAEALSRPPHRDQFRDQLVEMLATEPDPAVRAVLSEGVVRMSGRGAWMSEISEILSKETDPTVREQLLGAVARSAGDPAARAELLAMMTGDGVTPEERRTAILALARSRPTADLLAAAKPLLESDDAVVRANAFRILAGARTLDPSVLDGAFSDLDPSVRATALATGMRHLAAMQRDKKLSQGDVQKLVDRAIALARSDTDADVRRTAIEQVRNLPGKLREPVLAAGREDSDLLVRMTAYANSNVKVARTAKDEYVNGLRSDDPGTRSYAYRQIQRLYGVDVAYNASWNDKARTKAETDILLQLSEKPN